MDIVLTAAEIRRGQTLFGQLAAVGTATHDRSTAGSSELRERLLSKRDSLGQIFEPISQISILATHTDFGTQARQ